jgi:protocatechuate 3,4-dioxygenase beta subunit
MKLFVLSLLLLFLTQQRPSTPRAQIEGTVLRVDSMEPISGASVTVIRVNGSTGEAIRTAAALNGNFTTGGINAPLPQAPPPRTPGAATAPLPIPPVTTGRDGKFLVRDLDDGTYRILITIDGFVRQEYGQRALSGSGTTLTLARGEILKDLVVRMTRAGNVSGRINDDKGQPASGVLLQLIKVSYNAEGQRVFQTAGGARTNDRGEYRIYWITPGRYYLAAGTPPGPSTGFARGNVSTNETLSPYVFTYYPGTTDLSRAIPIDVRPGSDQPLDFQVTRQQLYSIRGRIVDAMTNQSTGPIAISLAYRTMTGEPGVLQFAQVYDPATGLFEIPNVVPGAYVILGNTGTGTVRTPVEIVNADIENLTLVVGRGIDIVGRLRVEGGRPPNPVRVQLRPVAKDGTYSIGFASTGEFSEGVMRLSGVLPGEYRVIVAPMPQHYVKSVTFDRNDALSSTITIEERAASAGSGLEVVISSNVARIEGVVTDDRLQPVPGVQAVLVPDRNRERAELFKAVTTDPAGRVSMGGVAPGDYKLFAWEGLENFGYFDAEFVKQSESSGKPVHVEESARITVETKVISQGAR